MWDCRSCAYGPLASLFGYSSSDTKKGKKPGKSSQGSIRSDSTSEVTGRYSVEEPFVCRTPEQITLLCRSWENYVHPRVREFWQSSDDIMTMLRQIAEGVHHHYDPVLDDERKCVVWYGPLSEEDELPVIRMVKPGDTHESLTYVNRALVFLYADEESFNELQAKPKEAFSMACGNPLCVSLTHIALD